MRAGSRSRRGPAASGLFPDTFPEHVKMTYLVHGRAVPDVFRVLTRRFRHVESDVFPRKFSRFAFRIRRRKEVYDLRKILVKNKKKSELYQINHDITSNK